MNRIVALVAVLGLIGAAALAAPAKNIAIDATASILSAPLQADAEKRPPLMTPAPRTSWPDTKSGADAIVPAACCKVCSKGKPCGNSCIARDRTCTRPPGCAC
ncbi:MAG: hypothetical protein QF654_01690 [Alphaproteobacteria bacterium]|jgi:hypothetical protein|nr:hypothetical protein [Alphaproteobacteria bacterium]